MPLEKTQFFDFCTDTCTAAKVLFGAYWPDFPCFEFNYIPEAQLSFFAVADVAARLCLLLSEASCCVFRETQQTLVNLPK